MSNENSQSRVTMQLAEIDSHIEFLRHLNSIPLEQLDLIGPDGEKIAIPDSVIENWKFVGLNNKDFVQMRVWEKEWEKV